MDKDYYKILGVVESDSAETIKLAYRKLARKWHPDVAGNTLDAINKFKELNEAYSILSDRIKKAEYDKIRSFYNYAKTGAESKNRETYKGKEVAKEQTAYNTTPQNKFNFNWNEFVNNKNKKNAETVHEPVNGNHVYAEVEITIQEAISGTEKIINMLQTTVCPKCGGRKFVNDGLCRCCNGKGELTNYKKFTIKIPSGIKDGSKIRLHGEGGIGQYGGKNGDLYVTVHIKEENDYKIEGLNIIKRVPIAPFEAVLGGVIEVNSISGKFLVKIAPNTQNGQKIRLSGGGMVQNDKIGDMIILIEIKIPRVHTKEELLLYRKLAELSSISIRDNIYDR